MADDFSDFPDVEAPKGARSGAATSDFSDYPDVTPVGGDSLTAGQVAGGALKNFLPSAGKFAGSLVAPIIHPVETYEGVKGIGRGLYSKAKGLVAEQDPEQKAKDEEIVNAIGRDFAEAYGGAENIKRTIATDPVRVMADLSTVLTGGGSLAARAPSLVGRAGEIAATAGRMIDPVTLAVKTAKKAGEAVSDVPAYLLGKASDVSSSSLKNATKAGFTANPTFWDAAQGRISAAEGVNVVKDAISKVAEQRRADYESGMNQVALTRPLSYGNVDAEINNQFQKAYTGLQPKSVKLANALDDAYNLVNQWKLAPANSPEHTIRGFDALKQRLDELSGTYRGTPAQKAIQDIRNAVKGEIVAADAGYANVMEKYQEATRNLGDLYSEVLGGARQNNGAQLRKILKDLDSKYKADLVGELAKHDPNIPYLIAGMEVGQSGGHGTMGVAGAAAASALMGHPGPLAAATLGFPKVNAGIFYGAGRAAGLPKNAFEAATQAVVPPIVQQQAARQLGRAKAGVKALSEVPEATAAAKQGYMSLGREEQRKSREDVEPGMTFSPFKRGGRTSKVYAPAKSLVNHVKKAEKLILAAEKAKKMNNKKTQPLLNVDDNTIAHALEITKAHV